MEGKFVGRVLLVDDEPDVRHVTKRMLEKMGFSVDETGNGLESVSMVRSKGEQYVAAVMDLTMPGFDGFDICRLIKSQPQTSHIHVLATSPRAGYTKHKKDILSCGASACLRKPLDMADLMEQLQPLL